MATREVVAGAEVEVVGVRTPISESPRPMRTLPMMKKRRRKRRRKTPPSQMTAPKRGTRSFYARV